jgi:hypothetical protein
MGGVVCDVQELGALYGLRHTYLAWSFLSGCNSFWACLYKKRKQQPTDPEKCFGVETHPVFS